MLRILHSALRKAVAKHQTSRLKVFYQLQFPDHATTQEPVGKFFQGLEVIPNIEKAMPEAVAQPPLFQEVSFRQGDLLVQVRPVLSAAAEDRLDADLFRSLIKAMQRLDIAINRVDWADRSEYR